MSSSGPANAQARALLQTLCKLLPLMQMPVGRRTDPKDIRFGTEADEFVIELEKFITGTISRSQQRNQDITFIEATLKKNSESEEDKSTMGASSNASGGLLENTPTNQNLIQFPALPQSIPLNSNEEALAKRLPIVRRYVTQRMPIRLLCFEPHNSKLKITLAERADIYNHLVHKFIADFNKAPIYLVGLWLSQRAGYAILSHTWNQTPGELTYGDWQKGPLDATQPKCQKLVNFCKTTWENHGLTLGWIDTVCINKESSTELDESIRSMYAWYHEADVCITYLAGSETVHKMHDDPWFTRGWTLQELVAPQRIKFYDMYWCQLSAHNDDKNDPRIQEEIQFATTITADELKNIRGTSISRRMQLAANRRVTRGEDIAYCLMGIFDVSISTAYGEGTEHAFIRLVEEIFRSTKDVSDIFNWAADRDPYSRQPTTSLFPSLPSDYLSRSSNEQLRPWRPIEPLTLTHLGLRTPVLLMPAVPLTLGESFPVSEPIGNYRATVSVAPCVRYLNDSRFSLPKTYLVLDKKVSGPSGKYKVENWSQEVMEITLTFGTLNVEEQGTSIRIPKTCLAVLLIRSLDKEMKTGSGDYQKAYTEKPIVFDLKASGNNKDKDNDKSYYQIERSQLADHGMQLATLYL